jgi:NADPH2:quinone reductase
MRVVMCDQPGPPDVLHIVEVPDPSAGAGQVVVAVSVAAVAFVETQVRAGRSPRPAGADVFPMVLGNGVGGTVTSVGADVDSAWIGRPVVTATGGAGGYAEQAVAPVDSLHQLPDGLDLRIGVALLADGRTALALARAAAFRPDDRVLVTAAAGGVGSLLVQLARHAGVASVIALAGGDRKRALGLDIGAHAAVDYRTPGWAGQVRSATGGYGVDVAFDGVGGAVGDEVVGLLAAGGRYLGYGMASGAWTHIDEGAVGERHLTIVPMAELIRGPEDLYALVENALANGAAGLLKPIIGQPYPLAEAADAHAAIEARTTVGKTLLIP